MLAIRVSPPVSVLGSHYWVRIEGLPRLIAPQESSLAFTFETHQQRIDYITTKWVQLRPSSLTMTSLSLAQDCQDVMLAIRCDILA